MDSEEEMNKLICAEKQEQNQRNKTTGATTIPSCGDTPIYYCMGEIESSEPLMQVCIDNNAEATCKQDIKKAQEANKKGRFIPNENGPGVCSTPIWLCNGLQYTSEADYKSSECNKIDSCPAPPNRNCKKSRFRSTNKGKKVCKAWADCMGYN